MKEFEKYKHNEKELKGMKEVRMKIINSIDFICGKIDYSSTTRELKDVGSAIRDLADALTWLTP